VLRTLRGAHRAGDLLEAELARTACRNKGAFCRDHPVSRKRQAYPAGKAALFVLSDGQLGWRIGLERHTALWGSFVGREQARTSEANPSLSLAADVDAFSIRWSLFRSLCPGLPYSLSCSPRSQRASGISKSHFAEDPVLMRQGGVPISSGLRRRCCEAQSQRALHTCVPQNVLWG
jgi:hypothetical protein